MDGTNVGRAAAMTLIDWIVGLAAVALGICMLLLLVEAKARKITREYDDSMRRHVSREDQGD